MLEARTVNVRARQHPVGRWQPLEKDEHTLTSRELEVLRLVAEGQTDRKVAERLAMSHRTVNRHLSNILGKLAVRGRAAAVAYVIRQGWA